jgi:hypothetical protein
MIACRPVLASILLISAVFGRVFGDTSPAVLALVQKLTTACQEQNLEAVKACYDTDGASTEEIDIALSTWQEYFNQGTDLTHWKFNKVTYQSFDNFVRTANPNFIASIASSGPKKMGEHFYEPNLKAIGFITSNFTAGHGSSTGTTESVGLRMDGTARLILQKRVK